MSPVLIVGVAGMFGGLLVSRHMAERAFSQLSPEQKLTLIDGFAKQRKYASLPLIAVAFMFIGLRNIPDNYILPGVVGIAVFFAACLVWQHRTVMRRMRQLGIPESFIKAARRAQWFSRIGWAVFFAAMLFGLRR